MTTDRLGVYIHIPFCASKCYYCDFCSTAAAKREKIDAYVDALLCEIREFAKAQKGKRRVDTLYFGGGTPTLLSLENFADILSCANDCFELSRDAEITAEANPKTADFEKLSGIRALGINRLSIGMQSVHDGELKALGRIHKFKDFEDFYADARRAGFDNISVDLMYGIPEQTMESFEASLEVLTAFSPEHISSYCLKIEEGTRFYQKRETLILPDEDAVCDMYERMSDILGKSGYTKYEISNFAKQGRESRHNTKYWTCDEYIGFGSGAHSFVSGKRFANSRDIDAYIETDGAGTREGEEIISPSVAENEYIMLGMRLARGVDIPKYETRFGKSFEEQFGKKLKKFCPEFVILSENNCKFTDKGMLVSNYILAQILDFS